MDRTACVNVPAFPLQIFLRCRPDWKARPIAIVDRNASSGTIQWVNECAQTYRIFPGMRYAAALSLCSDLCVGVISDAEIADEVTFLLQRLWSFSPDLESSSKEPGVFWLDVSGLLPLYASFEAWASLLSKDLLEAGFRSTVAVGFSRFGSYAAAKASAKNRVFGDLNQERVCLRSVPLARLGLGLKLRDMLLKLGVQTLGDFMDLPPASIRKRFGPEAHALHQQARGTAWDPIHAQPFLQPSERDLILDYPLWSLEGLLVLLDPLLRSILSEFSKRHQVLSSLSVELMLDDGMRLKERMSPAAPTLNLEELLLLVRLRIESLSFSSGVVELKIRGRGMVPLRQQLELFVKFKL